MNRSLGFVGFAMLLIAALVLLPLSIGTMPAIVATHFGAAGQANGFMPRGAYLALQLGLSVALPLLLVGLAAFGAAGSATLFKVPNRAYWFAPERRAAAIAFLVDHVVRLGCVLVLFFGGLHVLTLWANEQQPAQLPIVALLALIGLFVAAVLGWQIALRRRFHAPP